MSVNRSKTRSIVVVAIMSALAFVLMLLEFALPFLPSFLKYDFSDLPAFVVAFAVSPIAGVLVELIKNLVHLAFTTTSGVGELANFLIGAMLVFPAGMIYKRLKTRRGALVGAIVGTVAAAVLSFPVNLFITYPFYYNFLPKDAIIGMYAALFPWVDSIPEALATVNIPFTAAKGVISAFITFLIYKPLSPILKGKKS